MGGLGPKGRLEGGCLPSKNGQEVVFEGVYGVFSSITTMDMWGHELEGAPICSDSMFEGCTGFIVQDVDHGHMVG